MKNIVLEALNPLHGNVNYLSELKETAKINRSNPTEAESLIWQKVLRYQKSRFKFTRQKPIGRFIADFYCAQLNLVIEIDGSSHNLKKGYDESRDKFLRQIGIQTLRFSNREVINNLESVKAKIITVCQASPVKGRCRRRRG